MSTASPQITVFGNNRPLLFDIPPWNTLGFGVPNFGAAILTRNVPIANLVDYIGRAQLYIMTHIDAQRTQPPSLNTVIRICKLCNRINAVLSGRQVADGQTRLEEGHYQADGIAWNIHPVPYFAGPLVRNNWMSEYNQMTMVGLTNAMLHSDNNLALTVTARFAADIWQYFQQIQRLVGTELLNLPLTTVQAAGFQFPALATDPIYLAYAPSGFTLNFEAMDDAGQVASTLTEVDLAPLFRGYPADLLAPSLSQYPIGPLAGSTGLQGQALPNSAAVVGTAGGAGQTATASAGGSIGQPVGQSNSGAATLAALEANAAAANQGSGTATGATAPGAAGSTTAGAVSSPNI